MNSKKMIRWTPLPSPLPAERMPRHVAIIMDGNGRWATRQGLVRINGHQAGADAVRDITKYCGQTGIKALTLYAFSTENWKRPKAEVRFLFRLLKKYLIEEREELLANGVRLRSLGNSEALSEEVRNELQTTMELTENGNDLQLCLALNYGAQDEILRAAAAADCDGDARKLEGQLDTAGLPPVDLPILTAGGARRGVY